MLNILIPVDGSSHALLAVNHAMRLVHSGLRAHFVVANVQETVEQVVATGDPANTLIDLLETHGCHAVIMAAGAGGGLRAALLGSVTQHLVDHSPVPVTVVRESVPLSDE